MIVIGITGGIASGKSRVTAELVRRGARAVHADRLGHAVLRLPQVKRQLYGRWGEEAFLRGPDQRVVADGSGKLEELTDSTVNRLRVSRAAVAQRVFACPPTGPVELAFLERVTHPWISQMLQRRLDRWRASGAVDVVALDAPVLYKAGWDEFCQLLVFVQAAWEVRVARATERGWTPEELSRRQASQPSEAFQRERADVVLENGGAWDVTVRQIDRFWSRYVATEKKNLRQPEF